MWKFFFFNDTATTEIYTLSLHDALPIFYKLNEKAMIFNSVNPSLISFMDKHLGFKSVGNNDRSEEHTSELQSQSNLVCRLLLEKKNYAYGRIGSIVAGVGRAFGMKLSAW